MKIFFTKPALRRLRRIEDSLNKKKKKELRKEMADNLKLLRKNPEMGQEENNLKHLEKGHRYLLINPLYKLIYLVIQSVIYITDVFDNRQNPDNMKG